MRFPKGVSFGTLTQLNRTKKLVARFYQSATGKKPVREWILSLSIEDRHTIGTDIQKVEFGWPIGRPHCAPVGDGVWEVRSEFSGHRIARVLFFMRDGEMVLLHGFVKKTQAISKQDLALAIKRRKEIGS